ncbi:MAG: hypothetical protein K2X38_24220 [Gemmataceae bacterium]|nr:hypothetical protein [Gemmataceae bacterium]
MKLTDIAKHVDCKKLLEDTLNAITVEAVDKIVASLPVVPEGEYRFNPAAPAAGWQAGKLHWYPVGGLMGNQANIKHAGAAENPIGERVVNAFEALIELEREKELLKDPQAAAPLTPRDAVRRYFDLPPLDEMPDHTEFIRELKPDAYLRALAKRIMVTLRQQAKGKDYTIMVEDDGIGQRADNVHKSLLSLGASAKPDKPYLIGMFGQGGSSAFAACSRSWMITRRAPELPDHAGGGVGWTLIKQFRPPHKRSFSYWAYLAASPEGHVPVLPESAADALDFQRGIKLAHVGYNFATSDQAYRLYNSLNHLLFNPVLPYYVKTKKDGADRMTGNAYRLSALETTGPKQHKEEDIRLTDIPV